VFSLDAIATWISLADVVVVLTGAGISTDSGIPDFRGPNGVWTRDPLAEKASDLRHYLADVEVRRRAWHNRLVSPMWSATPNAGHEALVELERRGSLDTLVTQNIDGLHQQAGSSPERVVEIHGNAHTAKCLKCSWRGPMHETLDRVRAGDDDPRCLRCGGILKSATISFGEALVPEDLARSTEAAGRADVFLAVGTSLTVHPAAGLPTATLRNGGRLVVVNAEPTPFDHRADAVLREPIGEILPQLVGKV
jgi:NAD-dependent deacetylase